MRVCVLLAASPTTHNYIYIYIYIYINIYIYIYIYTGGVHVNGPSQNRIGWEVKE